MKWSIGSIIIFVFCSVVYGASYAGVAEGLKYFHAGVFQTFRMFFGLLTMGAMLGVQCMVDKIKGGTYRQVVRSHFTNGFWPIFHMVIYGLFNLGIPHCLTAIGQKWVSSATVQMMQPFAPVVGSIFGHFVLDDEHFNCQKFISLILSVVGVVLTSIPSFLHTGSGATATSTQLGIGYALVFLAMCSFGVAPPYIKWKAPNVDPTTGTFVQLIAATIFELIFSLISDGPKEMQYEVMNAKPFGWFWPVLIGVFISGLAVMALLYLTNTIGAFGVNLVPFGQMIVGIIVGVAFLKEWASYLWWEIIMAVIGVIVLCFSLGAGIYQPKQPQEIELTDQIHQEEEELKEPKEEITLPHEPGAPTLEQLPDEIDEIEHEGLHIEEL